MPTKRDLVIELAIMMVVGIALAALGPFGSFQMGSLAERLAYWLPISLFGYAVFRPVLAVARIQAEKLELPANGAVVAGVAIAAAPMTLIVLLWNGDGLGVRSEFGDWFEVYVQAALMGSLVTLIFLGIERHAPRGPGKERTVSESTHAAHPQPTFLARLPASWNGEFTALQMEDHYVRAHSPDGSTLILMRLRDAEHELSGVEGLRVHRSWWVARTAVEQVVRDGRNLRLSLKGGLQAPVARDRIEKLRAAGWLD